jgi:hypothetical protein
VTSQRVRSDLHEPFGLGEQLSEISKSTPIDPDFFNDGHFVVLLSRSLGGSGMDPHKLADTLGVGNADAMTDLLTHGICLPIYFGTDCAMDSATLFVVGDLDEPHEKAWIARLTGKLCIPCGKLILLSGGGVGEDMARAVSGRPPDKDYCIYQTIDVPPGDYRVDVLAYVDSTTVGLMHEDLDLDEVAEKYKHLPTVRESYVVRLMPLEGDLPLPGLDEETNWPAVFALRPA